MRQKKICVTESCPTLEIPRPGYFLGSDNHPALHFSAQNTSIEPCLVHSAIRERELFIGTRFSNLYTALDILTSVLIASESAAGLAKR
jgi:hypothetical protein